MPPGIVVPKGTLDGILGARQALDDMIYNRDTGEVKLGGNALHVAQDLRNQIDAAAKTDPLLAAGDQAFAEHSANLDRSLRFNPHKAESFESLEPIFVFKKCPCEYLQQFSF